MAWAISIVLLLVTVRLVDAAWFRAPRRAAWIRARTAWQVFGLCAIGVVAAVAAVGLGTALGLERSMGVVAIIPLAIVLALVFTWRGERP